ncbi:phosphotransferase [Alicyclobacillus dauci]|uniref:Phosphotransferase n=1 Tax=Alicyclobacillus dauci TaxID=1475485 RepID=A0ABY6Z3Q8_9BACL|nr:phosphotransferase [Alicyclobacillus dauci]WAH37472.1 phosphotransferase [Alicyclobacillus dauci]
MGISTGTPGQIYLDLKQASENLLGLSFSNPIPLTLGLLNLKWKVQTERGIFVVKQFSKERYESFGLKQVAFEQEFALREQLRQYEHGTPCPRLLTNNHNVIHVSENGERFVVIEFMSGDNLLPGTFTKSQMYSLGKVTAHMHNVFNDGTHGKETITKFVPPSIKQRLEKWKQISAQSIGNEKALHLISKQIAATEHFYSTG